MRLRKGLQLNRWVILIALTYLGALLVFAGIYQWLYENDHQSFAFNSDIQRAQSDRVPLISVGLAADAKLICN